MSKRMSEVLKVGFICFKRRRVLINSEDDKTGIDGCYECCNSTNKCGLVFAMEALIKHSKSLAMSEDSLYNSMYRLLPP
jgi:hypothetical protein